MKRVREKIKARPAAAVSGADIREVIADLNPILRGWGNYFRTGNAATKFNQIDDMSRRLRGLMFKGTVATCALVRPGLDEEWFEAHGLYRLRGTIRYPVAS